MCKYEITATIFDKRGKIVSQAQNSYSKTHPRQKQYATRVGMPKREFLHAEIRAIIQALKTHKQLYKIAIVRKDGYGNNKLAKPCQICELAIREAGIQLVEYTV